MKKIILFDHKGKFDYTIDELLQLGIKIFCINSHSNIQERKDLEVHYVDYFNESDKALKIIEELHNKHNFDGILCFSERSLTFVSHLCKNLNLNFQSIDTIKNTRNKLRLKDLFIKNNVNTSKYISIDTDDKIEKSDLKLLKYPLVVKPSSGMGSMGVIRANNFEEVRNAVETVSEINKKYMTNLTENMKTTKNPIIIEEYVDGKEYVIETFSYKGDVHILSVGYKGYPVGPYFEETIYIAPAKLDSSIMELLYKNVIEGVKIAGIKNGAAHVEARINNLGIPYILEIGARIGGSGVSHFIVKETTGVNFLDLCLKVALEETIDIDKELFKSISKHACNYIVQIGEGGELLEVKGLKEIQHHPETYKTFFMESIGKNYYPYPKGSFFNGYPGFIFSTHNSYNEVVNYCDFLDKTIKLSFKEA